VDALQYDNLSARGSLKTVARTWIGCDVLVLCSAPLARPSAPSSLVATQFAIRGLGDAASVPDSLQRGMLRLRLLPAATTTKVSRVGGHGCSSVRDGQAAEEVARRRY
jgi:hypothetical protein